MILAAIIAMILVTSFIRTLPLIISPTDSGCGCCVTNLFRFGKRAYQNLSQSPLSESLIFSSGAPRSKDTIVSRLVNAEYWQQQCDLYFPTEKGIYTYRSKLDPNENVHKVNKWTKGWRLEDTTRLIWTNGEFDPWISGSVSSESRPGGPLVSTPKHPVNVIPKGIHCYDLLLKNGIADPGTQNVIDINVKQIVECKLSTQTS